jgi:hypothetical protein
MHLVFVTIYFMVEHGGERSRESFIRPPAKRQELMQPRQETAEPPPLPSVWDVLERYVRLEALDAENQIRPEEYERERRKLRGETDKLHKKGTPHDKLILNLYSATTMEPGQFPNPLYFRDLTPEEFQQFRSKVEPLSEKEISEEIGNAREGFERKRQADPLAPLPPPGSPIHA